MSLYSFFPMKKRKLCKTPNGPIRRSTSTLGKLKKCSASPTAAGNGIEILWDNHSPSPTTTIALAGKRRRRQNATREEEIPITDVSFVVQKLSENTSPVVDNGHSVLLEMWRQNKADKKNVPEEEFTSPPFRQTGYKKNTSPLSTPFIQRRTSKRQSRKATKQFMLEIRKLVDEIQKSDLSGSSQSQKEIQCKIAEDQAPVKRPKKNDESTIKVTPLTQSLTNGHQPCSTKRASIPGTTTYDSKTAISRPKPSISGPDTTISGRNMAISDCLLEDSFEWTEDDMDELILTCQLSSSGKGSLTVPDPPRPQCGLSPSQDIFVPETQFTQMPSHAICAETQLLPEIEPCSQGTQILFHEEKPEVNTNEVVTVLNTNYGAEQYEHAQEVPEQNDLDKWELNFDEDDSLLASAAQEFELSQEAIAKPKCSPKKHSTRQNNEGFSLGAPLKSGHNRQELLTNTLPASRNSNTDGGLAKRSPRKENQNKCSNGRTTFKESLKPNLPTTGYSSHFTKIANKSFSKKLDENPHIISPRKKNISKPVVGETANVGDRQFNKVPTTITNSKGLLEKGNFSTEGTVDVTCGNIATPRGRTKTKLTLRRSTTPSGNRPGASFETRANENHYPRNNARTQLRVNDGSSSPLQSIPGNMGYPIKNSRLQTNLEISKEACSKQTTAKNCSSVNTSVKESKPNGRNVKESAPNECKPSLLQNKEDQNVKQNNKVQENEMDFLLCEDDVAALLDDFNFDDVLTEATTQAPTNTTSTNHVTKPCTNNSASTLTTVSQKKYSKDEIERKRLEAQRRRLAKAKQKNSTQLSNSRISKR